MHVLVCRLSSLTVSPHARSTRQWHRRYLKALQKCINVQSNAQVKARLFISTSQRHMGSAEISFYSSLTSAPDGGELLVSRSNRFNPPRSGPGTHQIGGLWVPQPISTLCRAEKFDNPAGESKTARSLSNP